MDEIIPGLWIGDLRSALDVEKLKQNGIFSILSAMRGRITINETFIRHQILLDDTEDADILSHLLPAIHFIQAELDKGRGVLVHCQAGVSRSATIVAAYLMYSRNMDTDAALELIRTKRPGIEPNDNFLQQLYIFHKAHYKISRRDKDVRMFYLDRTVEEVMNGDGSLPDTDMFAKFPRTPSDSMPPTPGGPRRRIRCKMCRQELATREHMLDHGQLGPATPAGATPAASRRPSTSAIQPLSRHPSVSQSRSRLGSESGPRRPSLLSYGGLGDSLSMSSIEPEVVPEDSVATMNTTPSASLNEHISLVDRRPSGAHGLSLRNLRSMSSIMDQSASNSALEDEDEEEVDQTATPSQMTPTIGGVHPTHAVEAAKALGRKLSDAMISTPMDVRGPILETPVVNGEETTRIGMGNLTMDGKAPGHPITHLSSAADLAAQLFENPKLAALRAPNATGVTYGTKSSTSPAQTPISPPILINSKCSGYFVEPMKWMEPFLQEGHLSGKIICPNKKCGAKLGNYDWAGVCCGCKEWVTPGFCINRSKVDEVV